MKQSSQLTLLQMDPVTPPVPEPIPETKTWQQTFAGIFFYKYRDVTGEFCKLGFGALKKMLTQHAEKYWVDHDTGAPEIPSIEAWTEEVNAFFKDSFAAHERGFHFSYLLKQYGSFKKYEPAKRETETDAWLIYVCANPECKHEMRHLRSRWLQHKNKVGSCRLCGTKFNVNDVLNKPTSLRDLLPRQ